MNEMTSQQPAKRNTNMLGIGLAIVLASAAFFSGLQIGSNTNNLGPMEAGLFSIFASPVEPAPEVDLSEFWHVWHLMEDKFVASTSTEPLSVQDRLEGAISGMVSSYGDPYSVFLPPADATQFEEEISGNFGGVGMEVGMRNDLITVIAPLPNTPAANAGILAGDVIIRVDDVSTKGMSIDEAVRLIRGEKGTEVLLSIYRENPTEYVDIPVIRDTINIPTSATQIVDGVFVISLYSFNALAESNMREAMQAYRNSGAEKLVLDLRGNPGGFLHSAVSIAGHFLPAGKIVVRESFGEGIEEEVYRSPGSVNAAEMTADTFVVLIDGGSASASEILAGALKEHQAATVIGTTSFGKGSVQELIDLPNSSSLKVTVARWLTPLGISFSDGGLTPSIDIERTQEQFVNGTDPQLNAALEFLGGKRDFQQDEVVELESE